MKKAYSEEEKKLIFDNYKDHTLEELAKLIPSRSKNSVAMFLCRNKIKSKSAKGDALSIEQEQFIRDNHKTMNIHRMRLAIGKGFKVVENFMIKNNLQKYSNYKERDVPREIIRFTPLVEVKKTFERPPAVYSNPNWEKYLIES